MKAIRHLAEFVLVTLCFQFFRLLPLDAASALGGWLGRTIGPLLPAAQTARDNLRLALPDLSDSTHQEILHGMWDNLGRVLAEYPHLEEICRDRVTLENAAILQDGFAGGRGGIFISGHMANWEISCGAQLVQLGRQVDITYRAPNNPYVDRLLTRTRSLGHRLPTYAKGREGGRAMIAALKQGRALGILIDQKYNEGLAVPFFGRTAMTNPVFVQLPQRYQGFVIPARAERLGGARFRITFHPSLALFTAGGQARPAEDVIGEAHALLEGWIRQRPEQWLWMHKRWPAEKPPRH